MFFIVAELSQGIVFFLNNFWRFYIKKQADNMYVNSYILFRSMPLLLFKFVIPKSNQIEFVEKGSML
jgi:hypothetical protein